MRMFEEVFQEIDKRVEEGNNELTPLIKHNGFFVKHDEYFSICGSHGGKARSCYSICKKGIEEGKRGFSTAGSKKSPQIQIASFIAKEMGVPLHAHTPQGELGYEIEKALANGCELFQHRAGYNNVIIKRARDDAKENDFLEIPFGMECWEAVYQTATQVRSLVGRDDIKRIVLPIGSGMSCCGVLWGMLRYEIDLPVLGIQVGADFRKRFEKYAPEGWELMLEVEKSGYDYHKYAPNLIRYADGDLILDPIYEAKCLPYVNFGEGDLLWSVGIRDGINSENSKEFRF